MTRRLWLAATLALLTLFNGGASAQTFQGEMATDRLLGRDTAGAGGVEQLTVQGLRFTGSGGIALADWFSVTDYGATADSNYVTDGAMGSGSTTLTSASNPFTAADVGKYIAVEGAGTSGVNLFTTIATFVGAGEVTLSDANASGGAISSKIVQWGTDDTTAFQDAIDAAVANGGGTVYIPIGAYFVSRLDLAGITNSPIKLLGAGRLASWIHYYNDATYGTTSGHVIDMTGSLFIQLENFGMGAGAGSGRSLELAEPTTGIFMAQTAANVSNRNVLRDVYVSGQFTVATFYNYGVPSSYAIGADFYNYSPGAGQHGAMTLTGDNRNSLTSDFATVTTGDQAASDWHFYDCEWHMFPGSGADGEVIILDQVSDILFSGGNISGGAARHVTLEETNLAITFSSVFLGTESEPVTPTNAYYRETGSSTTEFADINSRIVASGAKFGGSGALVHSHPSQEHILFAASDETTALTTGTAKITFRMPCDYQLEEVFASLTTAQTSGSTFTVDINEGGTTVLSTKITIDNGEKTSATAATPPVISDQVLADDSEITVDFDQLGDGTATGFKGALHGACVQ